MNNKFITEIPKTPIRRSINEKDSEQLAFFNLKRYTYQVFVTNFPIRVKEMWNFYR